MTYTLRSLLIAHRSPGPITLGPFLDTAIPLTILAVLFLAILFMGLPEPKNRK